MNVNPNNRYAKFMSGKQKVNNNEREKAKLKVEETEEFKSTVETHLTDMVSLNVLVNDLLGSAFSDFAGSYVGFGQTGRIEITAYFRDNKETSDGRIKSLTSAADISKEKNNSAMSVINAINSLRTENTYVLNQETKDMLEDIITVNNNNYNWKQLATEVVDTTGYTKTIYVQVVGIDIIKVLKLIYGAKSKNGSAYNYKVDIANTLPNNVILSVMRLNVEDVKALSMKYGMAQTTGSIRMVPYAVK